jgi:hypothetical protein
MGEAGKILLRSDIRGLKSKIRCLSSQYPHRPACQQRSAEKHDKAVKAVAHHVAGIFTVGDAEDDRSEQGEDACRAEMVESDAHCFFPIAM